MSVGRSLELLPYAVAAVLAQSEPSLELILLPDPDDADAARRSLDLAAGDARVILLDGPRAAAAVQSIRGTLVATTTDETLWFPDHLTELAELLAEVEYGHLLRTELDPDGSVWVGQTALADGAGFRVDAYRRLGGQPGPDSGTRFAIESVTLTTAYWTGPAEPRAAEAEIVHRLVCDERSRRDLRSRALASWHTDLSAAQGAVDVAAAQIQELYRSRGEISAQLAEYAHSRAAFGQENADLYTQVARLTARNRRLIQRLRAIEASRTWRLLRRVERARAAVRHRARRR
ncbi:glycosyltransferase family A protein [Sporichthya sp.]|uniref:glycosyltransferase family A protein n=1 Tax=Sporichthya sp. TaxID=65475 RepID=UPI00182DC1BB|nr:glycosyltransferase family A protein [Sporichthya sp.]MBA3744831.1 glycosyltransferase family 2 protein [Sporichthya sp.]